MSLSLISAFFSDATTQPGDQVAKIAINLATFLTVLCWLFILLFVVSRFSLKLRAKFSELLQDRVSFLIWLVPFTAMVFSLYFSEFLGWAPCKLCWYQRGFIYTLALVGLVYYFKPMAMLRKMGYVLASLSALVSAYHVSLERNPDLEGLSLSEYVQKIFNASADVQGAACDPNIPCASPWFTTVGFLTTAGMALTAAATLIALYYLSNSNELHNSQLDSNKDSQED
jgi:disulfide bond formation protein DsbB